MISIVVPTIKGREHWLERCRASYEEWTDVEYEFLVYHDYPSCNAAWNAGIPQCKYPVIHLTADDVEPAPGWDYAGLEALASGFLPCPRILNPDGTLQSCGTYPEEADDGTVSVVARIPLFPARWADWFMPFPDMQYMGDHWITAKLERRGIPTLVVRDYLFTHHYAQEGRIDTLAADVDTYHRLLAQ
jgi:hypothetical protein